MTAPKQHPFDVAITTRTSQRELYRIARRERQERLALQAQNEANDALILSMTDKLSALEAELDGVRSAYSEILRSCDVKNESIDTLTSENRRLARIVVQEREEHSQKVTGIISERDRLYRELEDHQKDTYENIDQLRRELKLARDGMEKRASETLLWRRKASESSLRYQRLMHSYHGLSAAVEATGAALFDARVMNELGPGDEDDD